MAGKHRQTCSIAGFLNLFGDAWSLMIVREALYGSTRFSEFQRNTGAARNLLSERLSTLVAHGILEKVDVGTVGARHAYHITPKGESLRPLMAAIILWSNEHLYPDGQAPNSVIHRQTGAELEGLDDLLNPALGDSRCKVAAGPGASAAARKRLGSLE